MVGVATWLDLKRGEVAEGEGDGRRWPTAGRPMLGDLHLSYCGCVRVTCHSNCRLGDPSPLLWSCRARCPSRLLVRSRHSRHRRRPTGGCFAWCACVDCADSRKKEVAHRSSDERSQWMAAAVLPAPPAAHNSCTWFGCSTAVSPAPSAWPAPSHSGDSLLKLQEQKAQQQISQLQKKNNFWSN